MFVMRRLVIGTCVVGALLAPAARSLWVSSVVPAPRAVHVVEAGETLWGIARGWRPAQDPRAVVDAIMRVNRLRSASIFPGQRLNLPAP
ncbi:MAG: LysM peptidoglycan-binding domain-containing protein [Acidobacteria bacterium]|nr:LysM peptidoglycan-binding domain-containing protein [Acidobacteriota bacterium]